MVCLAASTAIPTGLLPTVTVGTAQGNLGGMIKFAANAAAARRSMPAAAMRKRDTAGLIVL
jgi:hypothetical protein